MSAIADAVSEVLEAAKTVPVTCPNCGTVNRVDAEDVADGGADEAAEGEPPITCKKCGKSLMGALKAKARRGGTGGAVAEAVREASFGGLVKCPECGTLNVKSAAKCKNCKHDMTQVTKAARQDGRSHVAEAVLGVLEASNGSRSGRRAWRSRRGKFADLATLATGKRSAPKAEDKASTPVAAGSAESAGPTSVAEAADSMAKASTPEPFSRSKTSNWVARVGGLPAYIQHIAHDLMEKRGKSESEAIAMAVGIVKRWAAGGGKVDANTRAAAAKAVAEWEAKKAASHARESAVAHAILVAFDGEPDWGELPVTEAEERVALDAVQQTRRSGVQEAVWRALG